MTRTICNFRLLVAACLLGMAGSAQAVWPFNESDESKAEKLVTQGNQQLQAADELWRAGNAATVTVIRASTTAKAAEIYQAAAITYGEAEKLSPNLLNGLIKLRISYCAGQIEQIQEAAKPKPEPRVAVTHPAGLARGAGGGASSSEQAEVDVRRELASAQRCITGAHPEDAVPFLINVLRVDPTDRRALLLMATVRIQQGRYDDAIVTIEGLRSGAYCGAGRYFDALLALDKVMKKTPDLPQAHIDMAYLLLEMGPEKRGDAEAYYKYARKLGIPRDAALEKRLGMKPE